MLLRFTEKLFQRSSIDLKCSKLFKKIVAKQRNQKCKNSTILLSFKLGLPLFMICTTTMSSGPFDVMVHRVMHIMNTVRKECIREY